MCVYIRVDYHCVECVCVMCCLITECLFCGLASSFMYRDAKERPSNPERNFISVADILWSSFDLRVQTRWWVGGKRRDTGEGKSFQPISFLSLLKQKQGSEKKELQQLRVKEGSDARLFWK